MTKDEWVLQYGEPCKCSGVRGTYLTSPPICGQCDTRIMEDHDLGITLDTAPATGEYEHRGWVSTGVEGRYVATRT